MYSRLSDGTPVLIRRILPADKQMLSEGLAGLSEESRRLRFLGAKPRFTAGELRYLTEVDGCDHYALVAQLADDPTAIVAVGRFVRLKTDRTAAEVAIVVSDRLQRKRLGTQLARMLGDAARSRGIRRFVATMLSDNPAAMRLMRTLSTRVRDCGHDHGVHEVRMDLVA